MSEAPKEFQPIQTLEESLRLLREGAKSFASVLIWTKSQGVVVHSQLSVFSEKEKLLIFHRPEEMELKAFMEEVAGAGSECFFSISLATANIFFKAKFDGLDKAGFRFFLPEKIFKVQRRSDLRFRVPEGHVLKVEFDNPLLPAERQTKKVFDVSAGGLSFLTEMSDESVFIKGVILQRIEFAVNGRKILTDGEVRHRKAINTAKGELLKVGVLFRNLKAVDGQHLAQYTFEESRRYFLKFV